jgi:hypothetical protein
VRMLMDETVNRGEGHGGIREHGRPFAEWSIRGDQNISFNSRRRARWSQAGLRGIAMLLSPQLQAPWRDLQ